MKRSKLKIAISAIIVLISTLYSFDGLADRSEESSTSETKNSFVNLDRVWEVVYRYYGSVTVKRYAFRGTETLNDKGYNRFCCISEAKGEIMSWNILHDDPNYERFKDKFLIKPEGFVEKEVPELACLIRQEGSKVYIADDKSEFFETSPYRDEPIYQSFSEDKTEYLNFDMDVQPGDKWNIMNMCYEESYPVVAEVEIIQNDQIVNIEGEECRIYELFTNAVTPKHIDLNPEKYVIIEGLGIVQTEAYFYSPTTISSFFGHPTNDSAYFLNNVYNSEGEIIYKGAGFECTTSGVDRIYSDTAIDLYHENGVVYAESEGDEEISLRIYYTDGSVVAAATGTGNVEYPLSGLQKGVYIVKAVAGKSASKTIRLVI